jgi:hypothetical protein
MAGKSPTVVLAFSTCTAGTGPWPSEHPAISVAAAATATDVTTDDRRRANAPERHRCLQ